MKARIRSCIGGIFLAALQSSCTGCPVGNHIPQLSEKEVVALANAAALKSGVQLDSFLAPVAVFELAEKNCKWFVHYEGKSIIVGSHFGVLVDDRTRKTEVGVGM